jgi:hypothetical protein
MNHRHLWLGLMCAVAWGEAAAAAPSRAKSLAKFDAGYAQCEKQFPDMRGHGDQVYASLYRLKLDEALRTQFSDTRKSAPYKSERRRAAQNLTKSAAASDVVQRLELQCQALQREIKNEPAAAKR